ncbi:hypothetical protein ACFSCX_02760 [Bacillus salitolerans]|uniref:Uncharacterized protein n=1 Tax=Bacillus salitolerans TaxID=1437434 RepID=A0ABW4LN38_9BACI
MNLDSVILTIWEPVYIHEKPPSCFLIEYVSKKEDGLDIIIKGGLWIVKITVP